MKTIRTPYDVMTAARAYVRARMNIDDAQLGDAEVIRLYYRSCVFCARTGLLLFVRRSPTPRLARRYSFQLEAGVSGMLRVLQVRMRRVIAGVGPMWRMSAEGFFMDDQAVYYEGAAMALIRQADLVVHGGVSRLKPALDADLSPRTIAALFEGYDDDTEDEDQQRFRREWWASGCDPEVLAVYSDWLEERGDPRASLAREAAGLVTV